MNHYRYKLEKHKGPATKYTCPSCGLRRKFTRYVDTETGAYVADHVGRCDRQDSCAYHVRPSAFFREHPALAPGKGGHHAPVITAPAGALREVVHAPVAAAQPASYIPMEHVQRSFMHYAENNFVQYLYTLGHDRSLVNRRILQYRIGTSDHWHGASIWWQIDAQMRYHTGKIMLYDRDTGRRVREPFSHVTWAHSALRLPDFNLRQCLFGEQLLAHDTSSPVAITESEKSAVIASLYMPEFVWMAAGGKDMLTAEKVEPLSGRTVFLYPDNGAYESWSAKAKELSAIVPMYVSDMMETEGSKGEDVADYLISENLKAKA